MVKTRSVFSNRILIILLFATIFANFCSCLTVLAYPYNTKINSRNYLYSSSSAIGSPDINNNLLTLHNITNTVSFTGQVNVSNLPSLPSSKPGVIIDPEEQYLTSNYTSH